MILLLHDMITEQQYHLCYNQTIKENEIGGNFL